MKHGTWSRAFLHVIILPSLMAAVATVAASAAAPNPRAAEGSSTAAVSANWPQFRGPGASGVADGYPLPVRWDAADPTTIKWKTPIPGLGHSSPVIWGDRLFITTAISGKKDAGLKVGLYGNIQPVQDDTSHVWRIYCLDAASGRILWDKIAFEGVPRIKRHTKSTHANSTPATDGKHVVSFFGSEGLACYDMDGNLLWKKDLGRLDAGYYVVPAAQWAFGSSPIIHDGKVFVQCDVQQDSFIAAFDVADGKQLWRSPRDEVPTWSTPTLHAGHGRTQLIVNGYKHIGGYDAATGKELWKLVGGGDIPVPTPVVSPELDLIFITNAHGSGAPIYAIRTMAVGDITPEAGVSRNDHLAWSYARRGVYMQTLLLYRSLLYACRGNGTLTCFDAATGKVRYQRRLGRGRTGFTASPVAGDGKVYFSDEEGTIHVVQAGRAFKTLATNPMGEICMATPAISKGTLFFRTHRHVVAIGN
ncbi:MAG: PQQ-binding-like beta-propeller repeat protein [Phycisphaerae bacterium]